MMIYKNFKDNNYLISKKRVSRFKYFFKLDEFFFQYSDRSAYYFENKKTKLIIFGFLVDSHNYKKSLNDIAAELIFSRNVSELILKSNKLAGRFILVYKSVSDFIVLPDASSSIHVAYTIENYDLEISSNPKIIADLNYFQESSVSKEIKASGAQMHPLPYDLSMYDQIKFVVPNNYLDCNRRKVNRYYPINYVDSTTVKEAVLKSVDLLKNITIGFKQHKKLSIPLTAGIDSRTVLSLFKESATGIPLYTFHHRNFTIDTPDIVLPKEIAKDLDLNYYSFKDLDLPNDVQELFIKELGSSFNKAIAINAYTYHKSSLSEYFFVPGDIIPIVKSNFGRKLPEFFATSKYLATKTHNYSLRNKLEVKRWADDVKSFKKHSNSNISIFDLFFWEHRIGKWTANNLLNYDLLTNSLNIFNCRELIELWLFVPRTERVNFSIHKEIINHNWPQLLNYNINSPAKYGFIYKNSYLFYIGSLIKYFLDKKSYKNKLY